MRIITPLALTVLGITLSIYFTVSLLSVTVTLPLALGLGVLLGAGQFYVTALKGSLIRNAFILVLYGLSISATYLELERVASTDMQRLAAEKQQQIQTAVTSSDAYRLRYAQITSLDAEIDAVQKLINADIENNYRSRADTRRDALRVLRDKRAVLLSELTEQPPVTVATKQHLYDSVSTHYRQLVLLLIAVMVEGVTALGLVDVLRLAQKPKRTLETPTPAPTVQRKPKSEAKPATPRPTKAEQPKQHDVTDVETVVKQVNGTPVSARHVHRETGLSMRRVTAALRHLYEQQQITKNEAGQWVKT